MRSVSRMPWVDALKGMACLSIVLHHLAFYGPMSDTAYPLAPDIIDLLYEYGRMAVQVFFVISGFLLAAKFAPRGASLVDHPLHAIGRRYVRLVTPYFVALLLAVACAALARLWLDHDSIPAAPDFSQVLAHVFLLQDLLNQDALSAGVWYVAIDLQLFALAIALLWIARYAGARHAALRLLGPCLIALGVLASLFIFNLDAGWSDTALYFFGAYGLGALAYWVSQRPHGLLWLALLGSLVIGALLVNFRARILVAGCVMLTLGVVRQYDGFARFSIPHWMTGLGRISYSIFLIHFPLCMLVNAAFFHFFPQNALANFAGMAVALCVSIAGGALLFKWVENRPQASKGTHSANAGFAAHRLLTQIVHH